MGQLKHRLPPPLNECNCAAGCALRVDAVLCQGLQANSSWLSGKGGGHTDTHKPIFCLFSPSLEHVHSMAHVKVSCLSERDQVRSHYSVGHHC